MPIHSNGGDTFDMMYAGNHPEVCPHLGKLVDEYLKTDEWKQKEAYFQQNLFPFLTRNSMFLKDLEANGTLITTSSIRFMLTTLREDIILLTSLPLPSTP